MTVSTPPRPASFSEPVPALGPGESGLEEPALIEALREQALIEEARRHARRRRLRNGLGVSIVAAVALVGALAVRGSGDSHARAGLPSPALANPAAVALKTSGQLTVIGIPTTGRQQPAAQADGWYGLSTVGRRGQLHYLVRCPDHAKWCGEVESLDWSANGRWLALSVTSYGAANPYNGIHIVDLATGVDRQLRFCLPPECGLVRPSLVARRCQARVRQRRRNPPHQPRRLQTPPPPDENAGCNLLTVLVGRRHPYRLRGPAAIAPALVGLHHPGGRNAPRIARPRRVRTGLVTRRDENRLRLPLRRDQARHTDRQGRHTQQRPHLPRDRGVGHPNLVTGQQADRNRGTQVEPRGDLRHECERQQPSAAHDRDRRTRSPRTPRRILAAAPHCMTICYSTAQLSSRRLIAQATFPHTGAAERREACLLLAPERRTGWSDSLEERPAQQTDLLLDHER